jgi:ankyrin repeat protein
LQHKLLKISNPDVLVTATLEGKRSNRLTPLQWVASRGLLAEAKLLVARGAKVEGVLSYMSPPIVFAMDKDHVDIVALLLDAGSDPQKALFCAIADDKIEMIDLILERGGEINAREEGGWTAIHWAARNGAMAALRMLLKRGCDVNITNDWKDTPLHEAASEGHLSAVKLLLKQGGRINSLNSEGKTPLQLAEEMGHPEVGRFLRKHWSGHST